MRSRPARSERRARFLTIERGSPNRKLLSPDATIRSESAAGISQMVDELDKVGASLRELADSLNENQDRCSRR